MVTRLPYVQNIVILLFFTEMCNCWVFHSVPTKNNKLLEYVERQAPIRYEGSNEIEDINEGAPPDPPRETIILTWPGTKWCGPGNIAMNYHDLGFYNQTDKCCRAHDYCSDLIPAGQSAHGLQNDDFYTKLNCKCDDKFHSCLKSSTDDAGDAIGILYFNAIGTQCFKYEYPIIGCSEYRGILRNKCVKYDLDTTKEKSYQWFDVPPY